MRRLSLLFAIAAAPLAAQDFIGFSYNAQVSFTSRGFLGFGAIPGEVMTRIEADDYAGWGTATPGSRTVESVFFIVQDQDAVTTPEVFDIKLYPEDPANPGFPDIPNGILFSAGVAGPAAPGTGVISAAARIVTVAGGVAVPRTGGGDVFVSFVLPPSPTASTADGLSIQALNGNSAAPTAVMDVQGPTGQPLTPAGQINSYGITYNPGTSTLTYSVARVWIIDVAHAGNGGAALTVTNQTTLLGSANPPPAGFGPAPGTASFMSGSSPDANSFSVGRVDDITFDYFRTGLGTGSLVLFLMSFDPTFAPVEIPVTGLGFAGSGVVCLTNPQISLIGFSATDEAFFTLAIPASFRGRMAGLTIRQQAAGIDATGGIHASPCTAQRF